MLSLAPVTIIAARVNCMTGFKEIDHSGDIGIEAYGDSFNMLLCNLARGLFQLLVRDRVEPARSRRISVRSQSREDLLVDWLSAIITCAASHNEIYGGLRLDSIGDHFIEAELFGEPIDPGKHDLRFEVKAATYHNLLYTHEEGIFRARVILDL
jgi:SHS2 domain-containing protein